MINIALHAIGYAALAFSVVGFFELVLGFVRANSYNLLRAIVYCSLFGIGLSLVLH